MKVGDYGRTIYGQITKVKYKWEKLNISQRIIKVTVQCEDDELYDYPNEIKSSPDITDLIEVGDVLSYKDGSICRIMEITDKGYCLLKDYGGEQYYESKEWLKDIKSIVTKEQFKNMEYRIGG